jgi:magnesium transporter
MRGGGTTRSRRFDVAIKNIGREAELVSREQESLHSLDRVVTYVANIAADEDSERTLRARLKTAARDIDSLIHHSDALNGKIQFLLDATLGLISMEQNNVMKLFSVVSVSLMPPTLVGAIYGMNFKHMPELEWASGYPMAIALMVLSGVLPYLYCRKKGWL